MKKLFICMVLAFAPVVAQAAPGDMSVATFITKATALEKQGPLALMSSDLRLLKAEMTGAGAFYRAQLAADKNAGRAPHSCPPAKGSVKMNSNEIMAHMRSYPVAQRNSVSLKQAFRDMMGKRFPCR